MKQRHKQDRSAPSKHSAVGAKGNRFAVPFSGNDEMIEAAVVLFRARAALDQLEGGEDTDDKKGDAARARERQLTETWHARVRCTPRNVGLADVFARHRLKRLEREIVMALLLHPLGLWKDDVDDVGDVLSVLALPTTGSIEAIRCLSEDGRLHRRGLLHYDDPDESLRERDVVLDSAVVDMILKKGQAARSAFQVANERELHTTLSRVTRIMRKKSDTLDNIQRDIGGHAEFHKWRRTLQTLLTQLGQACDAHTQWRIARVRDEFVRWDDWTVLLGLLGKSLGHVAQDDDLFKGAGLARAACRSPEDFQAKVSRLMSDGPLARKDYIRPCGGDAGLLTESPDAIQEAEFELTEKAMAAFGLDESRRAATKHDTELRTPSIGLSDMALSDTVREAIDMGLSHARHTHRIMKTWGLGERITYGHGVIMVFYGPPGTGKTATAEAIAHELDRPLYVVDYSRLQNCFVGQTEKNIVAAFRKARHYNAVLFWDEADAMFFDRDTAGRSWEVRDVNVLLQEIERFEGVCILATNRTAALDKALARRITARIEFPRPGRRQREAIWRKLIPARLPLAPDVDFHALSDRNLSGGEIKNVVLNATRLACHRDSSRVTKADFEKAIVMEAQGCLGARRTQSIGFTRQT